MTRAATASVRTLFLFFFVLVRAITTHIRCACHESAWLYMKRTHYACADKHSCFFAPSVLVNRTYDG